MQLLMFVIDTCVGYMSKQVTRRLVQAYYRLHLVGLHIWKIYTIYTSPFVGLRSISVSST